MNLQDIIEDCKKRINRQLPLIIGIKYPESYCFSLKIPAFSFGGVTGFLGVIAISDNCMKVLNDEEIGFVIYHELSHISNSDTPSKVILEATKRILLPAWMTWEIIREIFGICSITEKINKAQEFRADRDAARWLGKKEVAESALKKVCKEYFGGDLDKYSPTHPTFRERIEAIRGLSIKAGGKV